MVINNKHATGSSFIDIFALVGFVLRKSKSRFYLRVKVEVAKWKGGILIPKYGPEYQVFKLHHCGMSILQILDHIRSTRLQTI